MVLTVNIKIIWICGLALTILGFWISLPVLRKIKCGQFIRLEGPKRHQSKKGTPTMGGLVMIVAGLILWWVMLLNQAKTVFSLSCLFLAVALLGYGLLGFFDDLLKIVRKNNLGLKPSVKLFIQMMLGVMLSAIYLRTGLNTSVTILKWEIPLGFFYVVLLVLLFGYVVNAVNLTDGLDGLAGGLLLIAYGAFSVLAYHESEWEVFYFGIAQMASLIAFLLFNFHPAKVFMGDTGSLAYGAGLGAMAVLLKREFLLLIIGGIFLWEILSVIIQVWYFKRTKGKRIFLMSPYHHHLELKGLSEWQIDFYLWSVGLVLAIIGIVLGVWV